MILLLFKCFGTTISNWQITNIIYVCKKKKYFVHWKAFLYILTELDSDFQIVQNFMFNVLVIVDKNKIKLKK